MFRSITLFVLTLALSIVAGCSKKPVGGPPPAGTKKDAKQEPKEEKVEPKPDEPVKLTIVDTPPTAQPTLWVVGQAPPPVNTAPISFPSNSLYSTTGIAARPDAGRAVISVKTEKTVKGPKGPTTQPGPTALLWCSTTEGKTLLDWPIDGNNTVLDLSPDARMILLTSTNPGKDRASLHLYLVEPGDRLKRVWSSKPHGIPEGGPPKTSSGRQLTEAECIEVKWAAFVGNDRIVSASQGGQIRIYDIDGPRQVATIDATPCRPDITPDGTRVAFLAGENIALLDVAAAKVVSTRLLGPAPPFPVLAFSPDGKRLAVGGNGEVSLMDMESGNVRQITLPKLRIHEVGVADKAFGWAGNQYLLANDQLHDLSYPLPVWEYKGIEQVRFSGNSIWACVRSPGSSTVTARQFTLPNADLTAQVSAAKGQAALFALKKGGSLKLDLNGIPAERRGEVQGQLEARLKELGYVLDPNAPATLVASIDMTGTPTLVQYPKQPFTYSRKPAKLDLVVGGQKVWSEAWAIAPPFTFPPSANTKPEAAAAAFAETKAGTPDYTLFVKVPLPEFIPSPTAAGTPLGSSELTATGVKEK